MKITGIETILVDASQPGGWGARNWCFVKVETDEGITGIGEASGWRRVIETAIRDLAPALAVPTKPGLGIELNEVACRAHLSPVGATHASWRRAGHCSVR